MPLLALTGATGFIGRHAAIALAKAGWSVRALVRGSTAPDLADCRLETVRGSLGDAASLEVLVRGADVVLHLAGAVQARDRAAFFAANVAGAARMAQAAARQGCRRLVHVSSLAARAPDLSPYAETKALGEREAIGQAGQLQVLVVRPPAVYGPGDRATLPIMRSLARGLLLAPRRADAHFSLLYATDLAALLVRLADADLPSGTVLEPDDGRPGGYRWADLARLAGRSLGRKVRVVGVPRPAMALAALLAERRAGADEVPLVSRAKVAELFHPDWVCDGGSLRDWSGWSPTTDFARGLPATLAWYRGAGWM